MSTIHKIELIPEQPAKPDPKTAAADRVASSIELVSAHVVEKLTELRDDIDELIAAVLKDMARVKVEIEGHVGIARTASETAEQIKTTLSRIRADHARLVAAKVE